ncbi:MAG: hypothetical protein RMH74_02650 [Candidatus Caldarchaeum sp.]|nr:hypothetical protein [Candidatus Caldarchaeum sp.]
MAGTVVLKRARVVVKLAGKEFETYVEAPLHGVGKLLLGRRVLSRIDLGLMGSKSQTCILKPQNK